MATIDLETELRDCWQGGGGKRSGLTFLKWVKETAGNPKATMQDAAQRYLNERKPLVPEMQTKMQEALDLDDADFHYHATDLYVLDKPGVWEWLQKNHPHPRNVQRFTGAPGSAWAGKPAFDIPFMGRWK